jgi:adenine deaminase
MALCANFAGIMRFTIKGNLIDVLQRTTYPAAITVCNGIIEAIEVLNEAQEQYILPGFIDAHIHIESSMLVPAAFAPLAALHGTVATVSDPHEIANVLGIEGVRFMIDNAKLTPFKFFFGAPSCVPATNFETAGAVLDAGAVAELLNSPDIWYLSEMMNYPGVLHGDTEVMAKIRAAHACSKPVDGHAPGLTGAAVQQYIAAGISTDHECVTIEEALEKIAGNMAILIREGSAAKNFDALADLLQLHPEKVMFCSDDKHPDELLQGHINLLVKRALHRGADLYDVLRAACVNPVLHYKIPVGLLRVGDPADFIIADNLTDFNIKATYISGKLAAANGKSQLSFVPVAPVNNFDTDFKTAGDFSIIAPAPFCNIRVIEAIEGQLITKTNIAAARIDGSGNIVSDTERDILKIAVVNRYRAGAPVAVGFIKNFGLRCGAIGSTVAHDSHNIIAVGTSDESLAAVVNNLIAAKGGISVAVSESEIYNMPLEVAGLMSVKDGQTVAAEYLAMNEHAKKIGTVLHAPFMTLSFMALLVIPQLKLSDRGLFDGSKFEFTDCIV